MQSVSAHPWLQPDPDLDPPKARSGEGAPLRTPQDELWERGVSGRAVQPPRPVLRELPRLRAEPAVKAAADDALDEDAPQLSLDAPPRRLERRARLAPAPREMAQPRDPSPSIWAYRMQRVMLTPYLRALLRFGTPTLLLALICGIWLADAERRDATVKVFTDLREKFEQRPEFMVSLASIEGASPELAEAVRARLDLRLPQSSFDLDLDAARARVEELDAIRSADLRLKSGGVLEVRITERQPALVWRGPDSLTLIDETGHRVAGLFARADRSDLPLVAGQGADLHATEALEILAAAGPLVPRVRGLVRMGERRWDIVLDRNQRILLPETGAVRALERLLALDHAQGILQRDVLAVDLRLGQRPTLRLTTRALNQIRQAKGLAIVETDL